VLTEEVLQSALCIIISQEKSCAPIAVKYFNIAFGALIPHVRFCITAASAKSSLPLSLSHRLFL
jgi:hypothetical protein